MSAGAAFANALAQGINGYMRGLDINDQKARGEKDDAWREEQRGVERERVARERSQQQSLADAVAPRTAIEGTAVDTPAGMTLYKDPAQAQAAQQEAQIEQEMRGGPSLAQARPAYGVAGTAVGNQITEKKPDVVALNSPDARMSRVEEAVMRVDPVKAVSLANMNRQGKAADLGMRKTEMEMEDLRRARLKSLRREGMEDTFRALQTRDPQAVFQAFNAQGDEKLVAPPQLVGTRKFKTPWGEVDDDMWSAKIVGPDGKERPIQMSTMQVGQQLAAVSDLLKQEAEAGKIGLQHRNDLTKVDRQGEITRQNQAHQGSVTRSNQAHAASVDGGNGKAPSGFRWKADGSLEAIPGGPGDKKQLGKPMPTGAAGGLLENQRNLRRAQTALQLISGKAVGEVAGDTNATGLKGYVPNQVLNRMDPEGVDTRAAIADLGSLVIHDRSGAAVTAAEFPRLAPFIPTEKDEPATARKKLQQFIKNYQAQIEDTTEFYRGMGYNVPTQVLQSAEGVDAGGNGGGLPRMASPADAMKLPSGTQFIDANGVTRTRP